jgi:Ca-activated chloride channel family protein
MAESEKTTPELGVWVAKGLGKDDERLVAVEVSPPALEAGGRPPVDLVLAVDRSSSMVGNRIAAAVEAARQICLRLGSRDRLGVIAFDAEVRIVRKPGPVSPEVAARVALDLTELGVGYGTNISGAWKVAEELITRGGIPGASKTVLLLTDGLPSRGLRAENELAALVNAGTGKGIVTSAVGIGDRFDEKLLARMAVAGGGAFRFAERDEDTIAVADEEVEGLTGLVAEEAVLHLGFGKSVTFYEVLHELKCRPDGDGVAVDLGRLFAGRPRNVLIQLAISGDPRHLGAIGLSCVTSDGSTAEVGPARILMPAPGQEAMDMERVGASLVPLLVARWQQNIWERGRDASFARLQEVLDRSRQELSELSEGLLTSDEAKEAIGRFTEACKRIEAIMRDTKSSGEDRRRNTELTLKGLTEESTHTVMGVTRVGPIMGGGNRGWGKK